jgi:hypothetical protein
MTDIGEVHKRALGGFEIAYQQELSNFRQAQITGDIDECARAAQAMSGYRASMRELNNMASEAVAQRQPLAGSDELSRRDVELATKYGLTAHEIGVAKGWTANPDISDESKVRSYVENRQRYRFMRQTGEYRDDQGAVRR